MAKLRHEVRDGLYGFIEFDNLEKHLIDSAPMQRLRSIHQLAMCYQVYPGATHKRFEHSLGVMEVAGRIFDGLFRDQLADGVRDRIGEELQKKDYWRSVVRVAALLHDAGHLPFSHAAEQDLLPDGWNHERLTAEIIRKSEIAEILSGQPMKMEDVVDVAWDIQKRAKTDQEFTLTPWKTLLNEIICGNTFGADRIDYLLRDSRHAGVAYGRFDPYRLIGGLRVVLDKGEIALGLDIGAIHAAEALLLARYFMYTQVYFHDVRRAYDLHLKEFLQAWLPRKQFSTNWRRLMQVTDNEILAAMRKTSKRHNPDLHALANRLMKRRHFRTAYEMVSTHKQRRPTILADIRDYAMEQFGESNVRFDQYSQKSEPSDFLVLTEDGGLETSTEVSGVIAQIPPIEIGLIFVAPDAKNKAKEAIDKHLARLLAKPPQKK